MEKRISFVQFQSVKSVAKAIDPYLRQKARLQAQVDSLETEFEQKTREMMEKVKARIAQDKAAKQKRLLEEITNLNAQIEAVEAGIVQIIGFHVTDLVKKVMEPNAKGVKETKYVPTANVSYDNAAKEYVVTSPDAVLPSETETVVSDSVTDTTPQPKESESLGQYVMPWDIRN